MSRSRPMASHQSMCSNIESHPCPRNLKLSLVLKFTVGFPILVTTSLRETEYLWAIIMNTSLSPLMHKMQEILIHSKYTKGQSYSSTAWFACLVNSLALHILSLSTTSNEFWALSQEKSWKSLVMTQKKARKRIPRTENSPEIQICLLSLEKKEGTSATTPYSPAVRFSVLRLNFYIGVMLPVYIFSLPKSNM